MTDYRLRDLTRRMFDEIFSKGNLDKLDEFVAEDFVEHEPMPPGTPTGREGLRQWALMMRNAFPDFAFDIQDMTIDGDKVWARVLFHGTNQGSFMGMPATGRPVQVEAMDILRFDGDRIVEHWGSFDQLGMMQQLGLVQSSGEQRT